MHLGQTGQIHWYNVSQTIPPSSIALCTFVCLKRVLTTGTCGHILRQHTHTHTHTHVEDQSYTSCTSVLLPVAWSVSVAQHDTWGSTLTSKWHASAVAIMCHRHTPAVFVSDPIWILYRGWKQESLANAKVNARQQCMYEAPSEEIYGKWT